MMRGMNLNNYKGNSLRDLKIEADLPTWGVFDSGGDVVSDYNPTDDDVVNEANARLIADAPLLLAEVKRLRFHLSDVVDELDPDNYEDEMYEWVLKMKQMYGGVGE